MAIQFNQITLDIDRYRPQRAGRPLAVEPRVFALRAYLIDKLDRAEARDLSLEPRRSGALRLATMPHPVDGIIPVQGAAS